MQVRIGENRKVSLEGTKAELVRIREILHTFEEQAKAAEVILMRADKAGFLPLLWEPGETSFNRFLREVISNSFEERRLQYQGNTQSQNQDINQDYYKPPYLDLKGAHLKKINLQYADLTQVHFRDADLSGADFAFANCSVTQLLNTKSLMGANIDKMHLKILKDRTYHQGLKQIENKSQNDLILYISTCKKSEKINKILLSVKDKYSDDFYHEIQMICLKKIDQLKKTDQKTQKHLQYFPEIIFKHYGEKPTLSVENGYVAFEFQNEEIGKRFYSDMSLSEDNLEWRCTDGISFTCKVFSESLSELEDSINQKLNFKLISIEPSAPPFETYDDYLKNDAALKKSKSQIGSNTNTNENTKNKKTSRETNSANNIGIQSVNTNTDETISKKAEKQNHLTEEKQKEYDSFDDNLRRVIAASHRQLRTHMKNANLDKFYHASLIILQEADKAGYLPFLWSRDGADDSRLNHYLNQVVQFGFENQKKSNSNIKFRLKKNNIIKNYYQPPLLNLSCAFLDGINMSDFCIREVKFKNSNLNNVILFNSCISVSNLLEAKSILNVKIIDARPLLRESSSSHKNGSEETLYTELSYKDFSLLSEKIINDYFDFFKNCTDIKKIEEALDQLQLDYKNSSSIILYSKLSVTSSIFTLSPITDSFKKIMGAGKNRIAELKATEEKTDDTEYFRSLANAYHG